MAALAKSSMVFFLAMALVGVCFGAEYIVGDSHGWTNKGHFDYKAWSRSKHFVVGDYIIFKYKANKQDVIQVEAKHFKKCKTKHPTVTFHSSKDHDVRIQLNVTGDFFYTSSIPGHCDDGQKVYIKVFASSSGPKPPTSAPSPSPSASVPSPSPSASVPSHSPSSSSPSPSPSASSPSSSPSISSPSPTPPISSPSPSPSPNPSSSSPSPSSSASSPSPSASSPSPSASSPSPTPSASSSSPNPSHLSPSPIPSNSRPTPSGPSPAPSSHGPRSTQSHGPSPRHSPSHGPRPSHTPAHRRAHPPQNRGPTFRLNPPPFYPVVGTPPKKGIVHKNGQAPSIHSSKGVPIMQVLMAVAVLAYIA